MPELRMRRPKGGYLGHLIAEGQYKALCGYQPSSPRTRQMVQRHGWTNGKPGCMCAKCVVKAVKLGAVSPW